MKVLSKFSKLLGISLLATAMSAASAQAETIVASHYGFLFNTAPIAVAIERGEFKKRGIEITDVISSSGGGTTMRNQIASGAGYGVVGDLERHAIGELARSEGLLVGPVYTGRAMGALIDLVRRGVFSADESILFWHTGDEAALHAYAAELTE